MNRSRNRINRIYAAAAVGLVLSASLAAPAFAEGPGSPASADEMAHLADNTLEWGEIDGLIHVYNPTVLKNRNDFSKDERRTYDAGKVTDYLIEQADEYDHQADQMADISPMLSATMRNTANSLRLQADSNVADHQVIQLQYDQIEKQTAHAARSSFLNYYSGLYAKEYAGSNIAYLEKAYNSANNRKNVGMATEIEVLSAKEAFDAARAGLLTTESNIGSNRNALLVMCGWNFDSDGVIAGLPELGDALAGVNYETDKAKAQENNLTLKMDRIKLANAESGSYSTQVVDQNRDQLKNDTASFDISFKAAYDALVNANTAYQNAINDKNVGAQSLAMADRQLNLGLISAVEHEGRVNTFKALELAEKQAYIALISARSAYDEAVNGL